MADGYLEPGLERALDHVERNGSLAWMDAPTPEVTRLYGELESAGYVERNPWSDRLVLTEGARKARRESRELDALMRFSAKMAGGVR